MRRYLGWLLVVACGGVLQSAAVAQNSTANPVGRALEEEVKRAMEFGAVLLEYRFLKREIGIRVARPRIPAARILAVQTLPTSSPWRRSSDPGPSP